MEACFGIGANSSIVVGPNQQKEGMSWCAKGRTVQHAELDFCGVWVCGRVLAPHYRNRMVLSQEHIQEGNKKDMVLPLQHNEFVLWVRYLSPAPSRRDRATIIAKFDPNSIM
jgi:hypothetical protein